ncbi:hypothetical protein pb186bvf_007372 [Paramecium bursaria]
MVILDLNIILLLNLQIFIEDNNGFWHRKFKQQEDIINYITITLVILRFKTNFIQIIEQNEHSNILYFITCIKIFYIIIIIEVRPLQQTVIFEHEGGSNQDLQNYSIQYQILWNDLQYQPSFSMYIKFHQNNMNITQGNQQTYFFLVPFFIPQTYNYAQDQIKVEEQPIQEEPVQQLVVQQAEPESQETHIQLKKGKGHAWSEAEIKTLVQFYKKYNGHWSQVVKHLKGRNISQCSQKYRKLLDQERRTKKKWSQEEDDQLMSAYQKYGRQWLKIAEELPSRSCKQVRDRFINKLDPNLNKQMWSQQEDERVMELFHQLGPRWTYIAQQLHNRSENQVKNRFYYSLQKKYNGEPHPYLKIEQ